MNLDMNTYIRAGLMADVLLNDKLDMSLEYTIG